MTPTPDLQAIRQRLEEARVVRDLIARMGGSPESPYANDVDALLTLWDTPAEETPRAGEGLP